MLLRTAVLFLFIAACSKAGERESKPETSEPASAKTSSATRKAETPSAPEATLTKEPPQKVATAIELRVLGMT